MKELIEGSKQIEAYILKIGTQHSDWSKNEFVILLLENSEDNKEKLELLFI